jgi:hypothetical protein
MDTCAPQGAGRAVDVAGDLPGVFVFFACDSAGVGVRAAFGFGWARLTYQFKLTILCPARRGWRLKLTHLFC